MICRDTNTKSGKMIDISKTRTSRTWRAVQRSYEMLVSLQRETVIGPRIRRNYACSPLRAQFVGGKNVNELLNVFNFTLGSCPICLTLNPPLIILLLNILTIFKRGRILLNSKTSKSNLSRRFYCDVIVRSLV